MGSGKSTVGRALARRLNCSFLDLDTRIEATAGCSIAEIFDHRGEAVFRDLEQRELRAALEEPNATAVLALGGGAFVQPQNAALIAQSGGLTVWLDAPEEVLLNRCESGEGTRPLAHDPNRFHRLYRERLPFYARARLRVDATAAPESVVEQILAGLGLPPAGEEA